MEKNIKITTVAEIMKEAGHVEKTWDVENKINGELIFDSALIRPTTFIKWLKMLCVSEKLIEDVEKAIYSIKIRDCPIDRLLTIKIGAW